MILFNNFLVEETLLTYVIFPNTNNTLTKNLIETNTSSSSKNIPNINSDTNSKFNIFNDSFCTTKKNPNDFETFNFDNRNSVFRDSINDKYNYDIQNMNSKNYLINNNEKERKSYYIPEENIKIKGENKIKNQKNNKIFNFSFLNSKPNEFSSNKSFINFPMEENKYMNILNNKDPELNYNDIINIDYFQNLMMNRDKYCDSKDNPYTNTYDSNYGKLFFCRICISFF